MKFKKVRTIADIKADPRVKELIMNYADGWHCVIASEGWLFYGETISELNTIKGLCWSINETLQQVSKEKYYE